MGCNRKANHFEDVCSWGQCGKFQKEGDQTFCHAADNNAHGQLKQLVEEGMPCPLGLFGSCCQPATKVEQGTRDQLVAIVLKELAKSTDADQKRAVMEAWLKLDEVINA